MTTETLIGVCSDTKSRILAGAYAANLTVDAFLFRLLALDAEQRTRDALPDAARDEIAELRESIGRHAAQADNAVSELRDEVHALAKRFERHQSHSLTAALGSSPIRAGGL